MADELAPWDRNWLLFCGHPGCRVCPGAEPWEPRSDVELAAELIRHLYGQDGCAVGGPLHVELDDGNIEGPWEPNEAFFTAWTIGPDEDGFDVDGRIRLAEIRRTTDRICEIMTRLSDQERSDAMAGAGL